MPSVCIIDDEPRSGELLKSKIQDLTDYFDKIESFTNPLVAYKSILEIQPDLVFLDIEMPQINGIELLQNIRHMNIPTVYVTAFSEYSITAIKQQIFDYILKPVKEQELLETINKYIVWKRSQDAPLLWTKPSISELLLKQNNKIPIHTSESINLIAINQIVHVLGVDNYSRFHFMDGSNLLSSRTLKFYEQLLAPFGFIRAHKSHLVNMIFVDKLITRDGGYVQLRSSELLPVSREKKQEILDWFKI